MLREGDTTSVCHAEMASGTGSLREICDAGSCITSIMGHAKHLAPFQPQTYLHLIRRSLQSGGTVRSARRRLLDNWQGQNGYGILKRYILNCYMNL